MSLPGSRVHHHARGFVDHHDVLIFVEQFDGDCFRGGVQARPLEYFDFDSFARGDAVGRSRRFPGDPHAPLLDQFLHARTAQLREVHYQVAVEARTFVFRLDTEILNAGWCRGLHACQFNVVHVRRVTLSVFREGDFIRKVATDS